MWQAQTAHKFNKNYECDDCIFTIILEVNGKNTTELEHKDEFEENYITVYVTTISRKTNRIKCDKKQKGDTVSNKIEMGTASPRGINLPYTPRKYAEEEEYNRGKQH